MRAGEGVTLGGIFGSTIGGQAPITGRFRLMLGEGLKAGVYNITENEGGRVKEEGTGEALPFDSHSHVERRKHFAILKKVKEGGGPSRTAMPTVLVVKGHMTISVFVAGDKGFYLCGMWSDGETHIGIATSRSRRYLQDCSCYLRPKGFIAVLVTERVFFRVIVFFLSLLAKEREGCSSALVSRLRPPRLCLFNL